MDNKILLAKSITLLYRESQLYDKTENSADLVRTVLEDVKVSDINIGMNTEREVITSLKDTILEMCNNPIDHEYDRGDLLQQVQLNTGHDEKLFESIKTSIETDMEESGLKKSIIAIRKSINNHFKEQQITEILNKASYNFKFQREKIKDVNQFIGELLAQLEPLQLSNSSKDPAVISDVDIGDDDSVHRVFTEMQEMSNGNRVYKTGIQALNTMLQGGIRPGEELVIGALQHKYKTGFSLSLFAQIALFNKPFTEDPNKKPLLLRISFEDELVSNLQFLYQYLKFNETKERVDIKNIDAGTMTTYVREKLQNNGFHIKMIRVDPDQWTYRSICNKVIDLEAQGYNVEVLMVDYLSKVSKVGCSNGGITGGELGDLFSKMRNFCSSKKIAFITPHQLSTEAKNLTRGAVSDERFTAEVAEKGYWEGNKGLDRIFDVGIIIHLFPYKGHTYLSIHRDKHRISTIIPESHKHFYLKFPEYMPIPYDLDGDNIAYKKLPSGNGNESGSGMMFD